MHKLNFPLAVFFFSFNKYCLGGMLEFFTFHMLILNKISEFQIFKIAICNSRHVKTSKMHCSYSKIIVRVIRKSQRKERLFCVLKIEKRGHLQHMAEARIRSCFGTNLPEDDGEGL